MPKSKLEGRLSRKVRIRKKILGSPECPRLSVYRSLKHVYAQVIDDISGKTLVNASTLKTGKASANKTAAAEVGKLVAEKALAANINRVAFDRNGFRYHGVIKSLADAARESGLKF
ncbi:50S ribosomal protein L18 [bacterium]|nr:50S ribosomal protein L18 [bacterium]